MAECLASWAPSLSHTRRMHLLAQFLFRGDRIHLPVGVLSGGERLRATLLCVLFAEPAPWAFPEAPRIDAERIEHRHERA